MAVKEFYDGKGVLITGATGFVGKVLVEKLLRSTSVNKLFLLIRHKKDKSPQQRGAEYFQQEIFSRLKDLGMEFLSRVHVLEGDVTMAGLGLSAEATQCLRAEVDVIFHGAATVRFDDTLSQATAINVRGTKEILSFAKSCPNLQAVVHISSVFAGCDKCEIPEKLANSMVVSPETLLELPHCLAEPYLSDVETDLCGEYPNTYTFTKAMAENLINNSSQGLPIGVFRPAIVVSTADEPIKGWADNVFGPTGIQFGVGAGVVRTIQVDTDKKANLVPVDKVVNALLAFAWSVAVDKTKNTESTEHVSVPVMNFASSSLNPLKWRQFMDYSLLYGRQMPVKQAIWCYQIYPTKFSTILTFYQWLLHLLPAMLADTVLFLSSKEPNGCYICCRQCLQTPSSYSLARNQGVNIECYRVYATKLGSIFTFYQWLLHLLPAMLADTVLLLSSKKPRMWKAYQKIHKFSGLLSYFSLRQWEVHEEGVVRLWGRMTVEDRAEFDFNMAALDWDSYFRNSIQGIRTHFFKETPDTIPSARRRQLCFLVAHHLLEALFLVFVCYTCWTVFSMVKASYKMILLAFSALKYT